MMNHPILNKFHSDFEKSFGNLKTELSKIRTGRANPAILDGIHVDYYGSQTPLRSLATFSTPDPTLIIIQPFDISALEAIEKAIQKSDLGISPSNDGKIIRLPIPSLTEDRRRELIKVIKKYGEETKIALRQHRREANDASKEAEKQKTFSEDDAKRLKDQIQKMTDDWTAKIDELLSKKESDLLKV
ncbi:MAG: ribosome recycling factor [Deltaproteobacteria bacterium RIFCSPHIGHO2_12_FULL_43_9]|nr:MAG: ribosome recycling factor [Deltaproteobacteria bacterium RIFCSPHIGHO2_12_FULL_43_9]